jgi:hypothetical protein
MGLREVIFLRLPGCQSILDKISVLVIKAPIYGAFFI